MRALIIAGLMALAAWPVLAQSYQVQTLARGLNDPWAIEFIPGTPDILVTQRGAMVEFG